MTSTKHRSYPTPQHVSETQRAEELGFNLEERSDANCLRFYAEYLGNPRHNVPGKTLRTLTSKGYISIQHRAGQPTSYKITHEGEELLARTRTRRPSP